MDVSFPGVRFKFQIKPYDFDFSWKFQSFFFMRHSFFQRRQSVKTQGRTEPHLLKDILVKIWIYWLQKLLASAADWYSIILLPIHFYVNKFSGATSQD